MFLWCRISHQNNTSRVATFLPHLFLLFFIEVEVMFIKESCLFSRREISYISLRAVTSQFCFKNFLIFLKCVKTPISVFSAFWNKKKLNPFFYSNHHNMLYEDVSASTMFCHCLLCKEFSEFACYIWECFCRYLKVFLKWYLL